MHAELATPPALPHPACPLPHSRDSISTTVQLCGADFARRTCFGAGVVDHVRPWPWPNRAGRGDLNRPVSRPDCHVLAALSCYRLSHRDSTFATWTAEQHLHDRCGLRDRTYV